MRRAIVTVGATSLATAAAIVALIFDIGSPNVGSVDDPPSSDASISRDGTSESTSVDEPAAAFEPPQSLRLVQSLAVTERVTDADNIPPVECDDEGAIEKRVREHAIREVAEVYSLLFDHLDLAQNERTALLSLLVDLRVAASHTPCKRGRELDAQDRSNKIAAIIGDTKVEQFFTLERNIGSYAEVAFIDCVLEKHNRPMDEAERDKVLQILVAIRDRELTFPGSDADRGSIESLEYLLAEVDERERLFFEQVGSALSAEQVGYLFEHYQYNSYRRADALERQKRARAGDSAKVLPLHYPVRNCSYIPR